jgi:hypothetical protein
MTSGDRPVAIVGIAVTLAAVVACHRTRPAEPVAATSSPPTTQPAPTTSPPAAPSRSATPRPSASTPSRTPSPARPQACRPSDVRVSITTDKAVYRQGQTVLFSIRAINIGRSPCVVDLGGLYVRITDPDGREIQMPRPPGIYVSPAPTTSPSGAPHRAEPYAAHTLQPGGSLREPCDWDGYVADPASGPYSSMKAPAGTYHADARWQYPTVTSPPVAFRVT